MPAVKSSDKIPAQPLLEFVEKMGGPAAIAGIGFVKAQEVQLGERVSQPEVDRTPEEARRYMRFLGMIDGARTRGSLSLYVADELCCNYLGVHPVDVYGMDWFTFGDPPTSHGAKWITDWLADAEMAVAA